MASSAPEPHPYAFACDQTATCHLADVAKIQPDRDFKNTLVVYRKIRVRVLDSRSGEPLKGVPVRELRINGKPVARYRAHEKDWDISKNFPLYEQDGKWMCGTRSATLLKASQIALNALGFNCGLPSASYGPQGKTAFLRYQVQAGDIPLEDADIGKIKLFSVGTLEGKWLKPPKKSVLKDILDKNQAEVPFKEPTADQCRKLISLYNTRCYRAAQFHLATLGYYPNNEDPLADGAMDDHDSGQWTEGWVQAFHDWQAVEFGYAKKDCTDWIIREKEGKRLKAQPANFVTNDHGDLHIPVPVTLLASGWTLEIQFKDFAVVAEATGKESKEKPEHVHRRYYRPIEDSRADFDPSPAVSNQRVPLLGATRFSVEWVDRDQTNAEGKWGWRLAKEPSRSSDERARLAEFRTSWKFEIPAFEAAEMNDPIAGFDWMTLHRRTSAFSMFYGEDHQQPEFVLFALVWSQPVWDEFADPPLGPQATINEDAYVWAGSSEEEIGLRMHVVTQVYRLGGWDLYGGKGYGLYEHSDHPTRWRGGNGHHGIDLHAPEGASLFAVRGGSFRYVETTGDIGNLAQLSWAGDSSKHNRVGYGHCSARVGADRDGVRAGEVIAKAGRTGNLRAVSDQAGHVHLNIGADHNALHGTPDDANKVCIPLNEHTPQLFPCRCTVTFGAAELNACRFDNASIPTNFPNQGALPAASVCWAVAELACPHMPKTVTVDELSATGATRARRRIQAQLRKLGYYEPDPVYGAGNAQWKTLAQLKALDGDFGDYVEDVTVTSDSAKIRPTASTAERELATVTKGTKLPRLDHQGEWYQVELPATLRTPDSGDKGWINQSLVKASTVSKCRLAIHSFKTDNTLLPASPTPKDKFEIDQATLDKINELAPLVRRTGP